MVCIPGGASVVGDAELATVDATSDLVAAPPRMVVLSPFFMDRIEITVTRLRGLVNAGRVPAPPTGAGCNYSPTQGLTDLEGVRCVPFETARDACTALGGRLPTAAQWEHAARGRGRETRYPWGDTPPTCATAALATGFGCTATRRVGSHDGDTSRDGVHDLGGSVREWVLDAPLDLDSCLGPGVLIDPICAGSGGSTRGGSLDTPLEGALSAPRRGGAPAADVGFRCVF
jgi:formylglycine-generating enzyme required for sulfatase activity